MSEIKSGLIISDLDKEYTFSYDGELLQLTPRYVDDVKPYDFLIDRVVEKDLLEGTTFQGEKIYFLKCELIRSHSMYIAKPAGYILLSDASKSFSVLTIYGEVINYFYRPNQIYDENKSNYGYNCINEGGMIYLKPLIDITKEFDFTIIGEKAKGIVSITAPSEPREMKKEYSLGIPHSFFQVEFERDISADRFIDLYLSIVNFFAFLNFQRDVFPEELKLGSINSDNKTEYIGEVYLVHKEKMILENVDKTIGYYFIENHINSLMNIINFKDLNLLFIPQNSKEGKYINPQKYITCCASFESVFNYVFPNAKAQEKPEFDAAKQDLIEFFNLKDEEYKGNNGKVRKQLASLRQIVELADYGLSEKYRYCEKKFADIVSDFEKKVYNRLSISDTQKNSISTDFGTLRNLLVHSSLSPIESTHVAGYSMARCYIYCMILDKAGIDKQNVKRCIELIM